MIFATYFFIQLNCTFKNSILSLLQHYFLRSKTKGVTMSTFFMHISMALISFITIFVPKSEYTQKCNDIKTSINRTELINDWQYDSIYSSTLSLHHKYMYLTSSKKNAPTILFIHGLNFDCRIFQKLNNLSSYGNLISYELPETTSYYKGNIDDYIFIIDDFIELAQINKLIISGTSFGGLVALRYAAEGKLKPQLLILLTTKLAGANRKDLKQTESLERLVNRKEDYQIYWIMEKLVDDFKKDLKKEKRQDVVEMLKIRDIDFYRQVTIAMSGHKSEEDASNLNIPVLIINGKGDHLINEKDIEIFKRKMPKATIRLIDNGSHALTWVHSKEITDIIKQFLTSKNDKDIPKTTYIF